MKAHHKSKLVQWQNYAKIGGTCEKCKGTFTTLTVDHVIPIQIIQMLDTTGNLSQEWEDNFELLCYPCNRFKSHNLDRTNPKTKSLLIKLLE